VSDTLSRDEIHARDTAWTAADGWSAREGRLWNEAWAAARAFYVPNVDEANRLSVRLGLVETAHETAHEDPDAQS
jgi:hypothetical protein